MVQETGCAAALALVARSGRGLRVIDSHGWSADEATAAARGAAADDFIVVGQHRDETWQILARPRPELDHRCSLAAIRKLVDMARTLDGYRRDEKQRAALWPAEALEGDAESLWISERSAEVLSIARRIASAPLPILLTGETGTGKEMLARVIDRASDRADRPLHPFNCTAVPKDMLESQLFGYRKGAFTGAESSFPASSAPPTAPPSSSTRLATSASTSSRSCCAFSSTRKSTRSASRTPSRSTSASSPPPTPTSRAAVADGRFREDLLYRLNPLRLDIPPLRERREEIPPLVQHYIRKSADEQRKGHPTLSDETLEVPAALQLARQPPAAGERDPPHDRARRRRRDPDAGAAVEGDPRLTPHHRGAAPRRARDQPAPGPDAAGRGRSAGAANPVATRSTSASSRADRGRS